MQMKSVIPLPCIFKTLLNINPKIKILNSHLLLLFIPYRSGGEKLIKHQANSSCVIMSLILMTTLFYKALISQGEIWCWSLLGLKGLKLNTHNVGTGLGVIKYNKIN